MQTARASARTHTHTYTHTHTLVTNNYMCLTVYLSFCMSQCLSACLSLSLSLFVSVSLSLCLCVCLCLSVCLLLSWTYYRWIFSLTYITWKMSENVVKRSESAQIREQRYINVIYYYYDYDYVASTVLSVPKPFGGRWHRRWTAAVRRQKGPVLPEFVGRCLKSEVWRVLHHTHHSSGAVWEPRWPSWAFRPNEPSGFRGRKDLLNHASALVTACP